MAPWMPLTLGTLGAIREWHPGNHYHSLNGTLGAIREFVGGTLANTFCKWLPGCHSRMVSWVPFTVGTLGAIREWHPGSDSVHRSLGAIHPWYPWCHS